MVLTTLPDGVWPVMITPFQLDGSIDLRAYRELVQFYIRNGAAGLFACCGSSELEKLSPQEMLEIISIAVETSSGRVPVVGGAIRYIAVDEQIEFIKKVYRTGVDAVILSTNQIVAPNDPAAAWKEKMDYILSHTEDIPLGTYEFPLPWKRLISQEEFAWMAGTKRFIFHKDTSCDLECLRQKVAVTGSVLKVFTAHCHTLLAALRLGVNGYCGTGANFRPELYSWLCRNYKEMPVLSEKLQAFLSSLEHRVDECENYPANAKAFINLRNVRMNNICRYKRNAVTEQHIEKLMQALSDSQKMCELVEMQTHS